jgi:hypothetical protein
MPALVMAIAMALAGTLIDRAFSDNNRARIETSNQRID